MSNFQSSSFFDLIYTGQGTRKDEKAIMDLLGPAGSMDLADLKSKSGLSGKKWDKSMNTLFQPRFARRGHGRGREKSYVKRISNPFLTT